MVRGGQIRWDNFINRKAPLERGRREEYSLEDYQKDILQIYQELLRYQRDLQGSKEEDVYKRQGFALAFRTNTNFFFDPDMQQLEYGPATDKFRDMLVYVEKLYAEGLIDPEFQTATDTQWEEIYANGLNITEYSLSLIHIYRNLL